MNFKFGIRGLNMSIEISKRALRQYMIIYIMLIFNQSNLYQNYIYQNQTLVSFIAFSMLLILIVNHKKEAMEGISLVLILLIFTSVLRLLKGGIGLEFWYEMAVKIEIVYLAILADVKHFMERFIKVVFFLALVSVIFWLFQNIGINLAQKLLYQYSTQGTYTVYDAAWNKTVHRYNGYGIFVYSFLSVYPNRNVGIFTEPGIYQSVLNMALFCIVFFANEINLSYKKVVQMFLVISAALITTQSTSGYFGFGALLVVILLRNKKDSLNWKKYAIRLLVVGIIILGVDYFIRGGQSLFETAIFSKVFNSSNEFSLVAENSTGIWRAATFWMAILAMIRYPMGLGVDGWISFISNSVYAGPGGWPFKLGAILGIIPFIISLYWIFKPLKYIRPDYYVIALYVFLYFNTTVAQTSAFYPVLIMVPVFLSLYRSHRSVIIN